MELFSSPLNFPNREFFEHPIPDISATTSASRRGPENVSPSQADLGDRRAGENVLELGPDRFDFRQFRHAASSIYHPHILALHHNAVICRR